MASRTRGEDCPDRKPPPPPAASERVALRACRSAINEMRSRLAELLDEAGYGRTEAFAIQLAYEEAMSNALHHGSRDRPDATIELTYHVGRDSVYLRVRDEGSGFDPHALPDPTLEPNLTALGGRGILLMRAYMTEVHYNSRGNEVTLIRRAEH